MKEHQTPCQTDPVICCNMPSYLRISSSVNGLDRHFPRILEISKDSCKFTFALHLTQGLWRQKDVVQVPSFSCMTLASPLNLAELGPLCVKQHSSGSPVRVRDHQCRNNCMSATKDEFSNVFPLLLTTTGFACFCVWRWYRDSTKLPSGELTKWELLQKAVSVPTKC